MHNQKSSKNKNGPIILVSCPMMYTFPFSYAYLAGYLIEKKENVILLFREEPFQALVDKIKSLKPLLVGFGSLYPEIPEIKKIIELLDKSGRDFPVVIGGQMVSPTPEFTVKKTGADFGVIGEGEITLLKLAQTLRCGGDVSEVKGLAIRKENEVILTGHGEYIEDLADIPRAPYHLFPGEWLNIGQWYAAYDPRMLWHYNDRVIPVHGGRGCPYRCNFCYHHSKFRLRPMESMIEEASWALDKFNGNMLNFTDDLVVANPSRVRQLIDNLRQTIKRPVEYFLSAHFEIIAKLEDDLLKELKETGCRIMGIGFESGSDRILSVIGKRCNADTIVTQVKRLNKYGIYAAGNFMIGQSTETREDVEQTIKVMKECVREAPNTELTFSIATPFPGSPLYKEIFSRGLLKDDFEYYDKYMESQGVFDWKMVVNLSAMSEREVFEMYNKANNEYLNEKNKLLGNRMKIACFLQKGFGQMHYRYLKNRLPKLLSKPYLMAYDTTQQSLDKMKWALRRKF